MFFLVTGYNNKSVVLLCELKEITLHNPKQKVRDVQSWSCVAQIQMAQHINWLGIYRWSSQTSQSHNYQNCVRRMWNYSLTLLIFLSLSIFVNSSTLTVIVNTNLSISKLHTLVIFINYITLKAWLRCENNTNIIGPLL